MAPGLPPVALAWRSCVASGCKMLFVRSLALAGLSRYGRKSRMAHLILRPVAAPSEHFQPSTLAVL